MWTFLYGGAAACPVSATARLENVESAILEPVRSVLLSDEAVDTFCREIRQLHTQDASEPDHTWTAAERSLAEELEDLESLIRTRPARGATLAPVIEDLRAQAVESSSSSGAQECASGRTRSSGGEGISRSGGGYQSSVARRQH